jgi:hypothetical protein
MVGIRRTDGAAGCPPTETPEAGYLNPFRTDSVGALWIRECFEEFKYFGAARHDIVTGIRWIGSAALPVDTPGLISTAHGVKEGTYDNVTVTNNTQQPMQLLFGLDCVADLLTNTNKLITLSVISRFNGVYQSSSGAGPPNRSGVNRAIRQIVNISSNPQDVAFETTGVPTTLNPGESGTVSAKISIAYWGGQPDGRDVLVSAAAAVRVYGHSL